jgi:hypothetical protein
MKIELIVKKKRRVSLMKKRNKRTEIMAHMDLAPLTEQILARMGQEGATIRRRLMNFYHQRACEENCCVEEYFEHSS